MSLFAFSLYFKETFAFSAVPNVFLFYVPRANTRSNSVFHGQKRSVADCIDDAVLWIQMQNFPCLGFDSSDHLLAQFSLFKGLEHDSPVIGWSAAAASMLSVQAVSVCRFCVHSSHIIPGGSFPSGDAGVRLQDVN